MENWKIGKFGKKLPFSLISWHSNKTSYARGGDFCFVFRPGGWSFALKSSPGGGYFDGKKLVARGGGGSTRSN